MSLPEHLLLKPSCQKVVYPLKCQNNFKANFCLNDNYVNTFIIVYCINSVYMNFLMSLACRVGAVQRQI